MEFFRGNVHLDDFNIFVEARRQAEVQDPVQAGAEQQDHVSLLQGCAPGWAHAEWVVVADHSLAHGGGQEGQLGHFDEFADLLFGPGLGGALAHNH